MESIVPLTVLQVLEMVVLERRLTSPMWVFVSIVPYRSACLEYAMGRPVEYAGGKAPCLANGVPLTLVRSTGELHMLNCHSALLGYPTVALISELLEE